MEEVTALSHRNPRYATTAEKKVTSCLSVLTHHQDHAQTAASQAITNGIAKSQRCVATAPKRVISRWNAQMHQRDHVQIVRRRVIGEKTALSRRNQCSVSIVTKKVTVLTDVQSLGKRLSAETATLKVIGYMTAQNLWISLRLSHSMMIVSKWRVTRGKKLKLHEKLKFEF